MAGNSYKSEGSTTRKRKPSRAKRKGNAVPFLRDRRFLLIAGLTLLALSLFLLVAFISYLLTGAADHSLVDALGRGEARQAGQEAQNWLGLLGALAAHLFVYRWFGVFAFLLIPLLLLTGRRVLVARPHPWRGKIVPICVFGLLWGSWMLGQVQVAAASDGFILFLSGGFGFKFASFMDSVVGWGSWIFLLLALAGFLIFFLDIKHVDFFRRQAGENESITDETEAGWANAEGEEANDYEEEEAEKKDVPDPVLKPEPRTGPVFEVEEKPTPELRHEPTPEPVRQQQPEPANKSEEKAEDNLDLEVDEGVTAQDILDGKVQNFDPTMDLPSYQYPELQLLTEQEEGGKVSREELEANKDRIVETLGHYKIGVESIKATIGPTVTLYEIVPEKGVKISKIKNLEDDIALSLAALGIRIIAPIPGKGTIGIEVPNSTRQTVRMRAVLANEKYLKSDMELPIVLGKTISNDIFQFDLTKMPHLLMAGATGMGKSVGINVLLTSLLYKKHPSQLKLVLIDPKKVELSIYNRLERHFLAKLPDGEDAIITDTKLVVKTLGSLCVEMDQRYDLLKEAGCRNLREYNEKFVSRRLNPENGHRFLPYIVLVIDELADLMMTAGKEVETPIARLAQLARAIGIHLVVATQRPSVNVITGIIKANFPARLSFKVTSKVDSRTILDTGGADQLIGQGDLLFSNGSLLTRVQCAFIDTPEVDSMCEFVGEQRGYSSAYLLPEYHIEGEEGGGSGVLDPEDRDVLFEEAARLVVRHQQGSTSLVQRKLKLGYNRAGRLIDQLEAAGIVGPFEGSKARSVLMPDEYALEQFLNSMNANQNESPSSPF